MKKNKANKKILIITAVAAVLLVGLMLLLIFMPRGDNSDSTIDEGIDMSTSVDSDGVHQAVINTDNNGNIINNSYGTLVEYVPADISRIHLENKSGTYDIKADTPVDKDGKTSKTQYTLVGLEEFNLKDGAPDDIANDAAKLEFSKVVSLDGKDSSDFGFDNPVAKVTVSYSDNTSSVITVGATAPQNTGVYVKFGSGETIYIVATEAVDSFGYSVTNLIDPAVNSSADNTENGKASSIELSGTHLSQPIKIKPNTNSNNAASYMMTSPIKGYASETGSSAVDGAIRGVYAESVEMVNPSAQQLEKLGLANPYAQVVAVYPDVQVNLISSKPDGEGKVYLMEKGGKIVYKMASANLPWTTATLDSMLSEYVLNPKLSALSAMNVESGGKSYEFTLSTITEDTTDGSGQSVTVAKYNGNEIDSGNFSTYYQNMSLTPRADSKTESFGGNPVFSVSYSYIDGENDTVSFYETGDSCYLAVINGTAVGHIYKNRINKLADQTAAIAANKQVESLD